MPPLLSHLRPNYGGGNEDNGGLLPKGRSAVHAWLPSVPPTLQLAPTSPRLRWRLLDTHRQVWVTCGVITPFSWLMVRTRFCLCPPRAQKAILCKTWTVHAVLFILNRGIEGRTWLVALLVRLFLSINSLCPQVILIVRCNKNKYSFIRDIL